MADGPVSQDEIIRKNIAALAEVQRRDAERRTRTDRMADAVTRFSGSMAFVYLHVAWFGLWIALNEGLLESFGLRPFDKFPFGLLTMIVSLEAIFLATFVLISQNRMARLAEKRAELDLHVNMLAEQKAAKTLELLEHIAQQLDRVYDRFDYKTDPEIEALKVSPEPHEVLKVMEDAVEEQTKEVAHEIKKTVKDITGEVEAVQDDVEDMDKEVKRVASDVREVQEEMKMHASERV